MSGRGRERGRLREGVEEGNSWAGSGVRRARKEAQRARRMNRNLQLLGWWRSRRL